MAPFVPFSENDHLHQLIHDYMRISTSSYLEKRTGACIRSAIRRLQECLSMTPLLRKRQLNRHLYNQFPS